MRSDAATTPDSTDLRRLLARVGVVTVTHQSAATIADAIISLAGSGVSMVVVDNASTDDTVAIVQQFEGVDLVESRRNAGFGAGCNRGVAHLPATTDLILFLNPDAAIAPPALAVMVEYLDARPTCALVGPQLHRGGEPITSGGTGSTLLTELRIVAPAPLQRRLPDRRYAPTAAVDGPVGYVEGACFLVRRDRFDEVGGFDERFFLFYEELDLANRLRAAGCTVDLCRSASAHHAVAVSRSSVPDRAKSHLVASGAAYLEKWHGRPAAWAFRASAALTGSIRARRASRPHGSRSSAR